MYEKHEDRRTWAREQMKEANLGQSVTTAVERLLNVWWTQNHTADTAALTLESFNRLAQGFALVPEVEDNEIWMAARPGTLYVRDEVRVKFDAYRGEVGQFHNRRRGRIVAVRNGDIIVKYEDGKQPPFDGARHSPHALEKRVR